MPDGKNNSCLKAPSRLTIIIKFAESVLSTYRDELERKDIQVLESAAGESHWDVTMAGSGNKTYFFPSKRVLTEKSVVNVTTRK